ncbi:hypothetical protein L484_024348 [Morus notabilis]|uniref:Uncharacterized protein n=1 Tax=Morus notabilis TaxID=981085 RepID=W9RWY1_9ROSA|nr:auxin-responsive protein SAUR15 [Morus notabilis]EXC16180.1 hypothetical protein L484_024348 [Morus notabilis]
MCNENCEERAPTFLRLRLLIGKLQRRISLLGEIRETDEIDFEEGALEVPPTLPDDVKEGHFAVSAEKDDEKKRFVVKLKYLTSPMFLRLLEQAEEEYGFEQTGALVVPCKPQELNKILGTHDEYENQF